MFLYTVTIIPHSLFLSATTLHVHYYVFRESTCHSWYSIAPVQIYLLIIISSFVGNCVYSPHTTTWLLCSSTFRSLLWPLNLVLVTFYYYWCIYPSNSHYDIFPLHKNTNESGRSNNCIPKAKFISILKLKWLVILQYGWSVFLIFKAKLDCAMLSKD